MMTVAPSNPVLACTDVLKYVRPTILVTDRVGTILQAHGGSGLPLGYTADQIEGQHGLHFIAPEDHRIMAETYLASDDLPIVTSPEPFPVRIVGPDGEIKIWDCVPGGFNERGHDGWVLTLTCRAEQNASIDAMDCFIDGGSALDITRVVARRYQESRSDEWHKDALAVYRDVRADGTLGNWAVLDPAPGPDRELCRALTEVLDVPDAPWNTLEPGTMQSDSQLPEPVKAIADKARLPYCTSLAVGIDGITRVVFLRWSNFTNELQVNNKLADKAVDSTLRQALASELSRDLLDRTMRSDPLTGIANRLHFDEVVDDTEDASRHAVLYIDIDQFKAVNDTYGHETGDALLRIVANRIVRACRPDDLVARIGGDEFAVILQDVSPPEAQGVADRINDSMHRPLNVGAGPELISVTVGIATPTDHASLSELVHRADLAMLAHKPGRMRKKPVLELPSTVTRVTADRRRRG